MPDPSNLPEGCAFEERCPHRMEVCRQQHPRKTTVGTHSILCHLYGEKP